ncbi:MAG: pyridoxal 5'-phosphate synthase glutaminase subunit PdxT [Candidatus Melainabacteria bacterium]|nr:pyridoxal 5'-phosphate synthase glutaminase subunit PdxT [Candidatus Melainabacteria bacterium]
MTVIGVLALQGNFAEHAQMLSTCGARAVEIRHACELEQVDGLIIPGGESTTVAKLTADDSDPICGAIKEKILSGMPVYGTCMGAIFLAKEIEGSTQGRLALMDIKVRRNSFGPQKSSFEQLLDIPVLGSEPFLAVFIRAPMIMGCGGCVEVLARVDNWVVMAQQANMLVSAFHPELTGDTRVHEYFLGMVNSWQPADDKATDLRVSHGSSRAKSSGLVVLV